MTRAKLHAELLRDEGLKLSAYQDSLGYWSIGVGRLIDARKGGGITHGEALMLLNHDIDRTEAAVRARWPWYDGLDDVRQRVLCNLAFNLGVGGLGKFVKALTCIQARLYEAAADRMLQSLWADQVGARAQRLARMMRTGQDEAETDAP